MGLSGFIWVYLPHINTNMKFMYGEYADVSGYLGPVLMIGVFIDMLHDGNYLYALVMWKWYVGIHKYET